MCHMQHLIIIKGLILKPNNSNDSVLCLDLHKLAYDCGVILSEQ
jgi:hypothetical protein